MIPTTASTMPRITPATFVAQRCWHCSTTEGVSVYLNGWDNDAEIALCDFCLKSPYAVLR